MKRTCPTWHGGVAYQPTPIIQSEHCLRSGDRGCHTANGMTAAFKGPDGGFDREVQPADIYQRPLLRCDHRLRRQDPEGAGESRHRSRSARAWWRPPAGWCSRRCRMAGWWPTVTRSSRAVALQCRHPLKGTPTYAIGPKRYLAVRSSGRHVHPVKYDNLQSSGYLFVFALN